jgi:hypothetical protein
MSVASTFDNLIEASVRGKWVKVPAVNVGGKTIVVRGRWLKTAIVHDEDWLETELEDPASCIRLLQQRSFHGLHADLLTFGQKLPAVTPKYSYLMERDSIAAVRLTNFEAWWRSLPQEGRKNVRRSQKRGVTIAVEAFSDKLIEGIRGVNDDSPLRQGFRNAHYGKDLSQVRKDHESYIDRSDFICAYLGSEMVGFIKLVYAGDVASILNLAVKASHSDKRPANALVAKAIEIACEKGASYLVYGKFIYGNKRESPLLEFKRRNSFQEVLVPRYYVPLTLKGRLLVKLGLHRGLVGVVPYRLITLGIRLRTRWYNFMQFMSRCSSMPERPNRTRQTERSNPPAGSKA